MRNRDLPAYPDSYPQHDSGLSKREAAAIAAMQGILASDYRAEHLKDKALEEGMITTILLARDAVKAADALFDELEKEDG